MSEEALKRSLAAAKLWKHTACSTNSRQPLRCLLSRAQWHIRQSPCLSSALGALVGFLAASFRHAVVYSIGRSIRHPGLFEGHRDRDSAAAACLELRQTLSKQKELRAAWCSATCGTCRSCSSANMQPEFRLYEAGCYVSSNLVLNLAPGRSSGAKGCLPCKEGLKCLLQVQCNARDTMGCRGL